MIENKKIIVLKFVLAFVTFLCASQISHSQEHFEYENPSFSFSIPEGWKEYHGNLSPLMYGKFVKVNDGIIGGILRVGQDIYTGRLETIWSLNPEAEKEQIEMEATLRNFGLSKEVVNGLRTVKINFETTLGEKDERREFKAVIYKFLIVQRDKEYIVSFFLITDPSHFDKDHKDVLKIISSLNLSSQETVFNSQREVEFNEIKYFISKPIDYDYFSNSVFKDMKINEFTKTYCFTDDLSIYDFELLVPKKLGEQPIIHFYSMNALIGQKVTKEEFVESKSFWKEMFEKENYDKLLNDVISDSLMFCKYEFSDTKPITYTHLRDDPEILSTLVFTTGQKDDIGSILITNYIFINDIVVYIKLTQVFRTFSDIEKIRDKSDIIVNEFLKNN